MINALDNAIRTGAFFVEAAEDGVELSTEVVKSITNLINHLKTLDPEGTRTAELIARLEVFA